MDQIVNTLCRYTVENGLLTRWVSASDHTESVLTVVPSSSVGIVISLGFVSDNYPSFKRYRGY